MTMIDKLMADLANIDALRIVDQLAQRPPMIEGTRRLRRVAKMPA
jgi:hypothetical protein